MLHKYLVTGNLYFGIPYVIKLKNIKAYSLKQAMFFAYQEILAKYPKFKSFPQDRLYNEVKKLNYIIVKK